MSYDVRKNCFGFINNSENGCAALNCLYCRFEDCKFYKTDRDGRYEKQPSKETINRHFFQIKD